MTSLENKGKIVKLYSTTRQAVPTHLIGPLNLQLDLEDL